MNERTFENMIRLLVFTLFVVLLASTAFYCYVTLVNGWVGKPPVQQLANTALAASISLLVVLLLKFTAGPIEVDAFKFKFKGASGPVVFWIFCFLTTVTGISMLAPTVTG